jgi:hypothetical protein
MDARGLHVTDVSEGEWIAARLAPFGSCVTSVVPSGFEAYARVGLPEWEEPPAENGLPHEVLSPLCEIVAARGSTEDCRFAIWEGYGWLHGGGFFLLFAPPDASVDPAVCEARRATASEPAFPLEVLEGPKLHLPHREYVVFRGPLATALTLGRQPVFGDFQQRSPDLLWPIDRSWFIATDVDLPYGYVGGSARLIGDVTDDPRLASVAVHPGDALA